MFFFRREFKIDFMSKRRVAAVVSGAVIVAGIVSLIAHGGPNYGIDFAGGTLVQLKFSEAVPLGPVRSALAGMALGAVEVQHFGDDTEILIRVQQSSETLEDLGSTIRDELREGFPGQTIQLRRAEMVGPKVGKDLRRKALLAVFYAMVGIMIYVAFRFELKFAVGAVVALLHDVMITIGIFSFLNKELSLPVIAALLTIIGYSLNDTIVVYDRIRENLRLLRRERYETLLNTSLNQTLNRTLLTSFSTLLVLLALFFLGGGVIHDFAFTLIVGVIVGTYSSIYIATPVVLAWQTRAERAARAKVAPKARARPKAKPRPTARKKS